MAHSKAAVALLLAVFLSAATSSGNPMEKADSLYKNGRYAEAAEICANIKAVYPDTDWAMMAFLMNARILEKTGKNDDAITEYRAIITRFPKSSVAEEAYFAVARIRAASGKESDAASAYRSYLKNYPNGEYGAMALFNLAMIYKRNNDDRNALAAFEEIMRKYSNEAWFYSWAAIYSGHIYSAKKDFDRAIESYQRVIKSRENTFLYSLSMLHRARAFMDKKDYKTSSALFQEIIKANNHFIEEALYGLGQSQYLDTEFEQAKETFTTLLQLFPKTYWRENAQARLKVIEKRLKEIEKSGQ